MPDPEPAGDLAEFVELLGALRARAGMPSYRALAKRVGPLMRPPRAVSPPTLVDVFKPGRRRLDLDLVMAIVRALGVDGAAADRWRAVCIRVHGLAKSGGPVGVFRQLPADLATFTGREPEVARLLAAARQAGAGDGGTSATAAASGPTGTAAVVATIEGMAGVGKTQLAVHVAHALVRAGEFTDLQLYVNLRGFDPDLPPVEPSAVLEAFLRQLGVPAAHIPEGRDELAAMYRDRLRDRRALVVLDNAADEDQVRDLVPSGPCCLVLVTSRRSLAGLDGASPLAVGTFTDAESLSLLARIAGRDRVAAEPGAAARIVASCDRLPLALALTAARLRSRPAWTLAELADRLQNGQLEAIRAGGRAIRPVFDVSYQALPYEARQLFRLLGLHPGPDFSAAAVAALSGSTLGEAAATLELLLDEHLVQQRRSGRFELHDLLHAFALDLVAQDSPAARGRALTRITSWYAHSAHQAMTALRKVVDVPTVPQAGDPARFESPDAALAWLAAEETNLEHAVRAAAEAGLHAAAWQTGRFLRRVYSESGRYADAARISRVAGDAARRAGDLPAEGRALCDEGWAEYELRRRRTGASLAEAEALMRRAVDACDRAGADHDKAYALSGLAMVLGYRNGHAEALSCYEEALAISEREGDRRRIGTMHCNIGTLHFVRKDYAPALASYLRALELLDTPDSESYGVVVLLGNIAEVHFLVGEYVKAQSYEERRFALTRTYGYTQKEAESLLMTGDVHAALHDSAAARAAWTEAAALFDRLGDPRAAEVQQRLAGAQGDAVS